MKATNAGRRKFPRVVLLAALAVLAAPAAGWAETEPDPLTLPLSPGSVALLVERAKEPAVQERWAAALKDPNPQIRAAAARVVHVTGSRPRISDLRSALGTESDPDAAFEISWALADLFETEDGTVLSAAGAATGALREATVAGFADGAGRRTLSSWPALRRLELRERTWERLFEKLDQDDGADWAPLAGAILKDGPNGADIAFLRTAVQQHRVVPGDLVSASLRSLSPEARVAAYRYLVDAHAANGTADPLPEGTPEPGDTAERVLRELVVRFSKGKPSGLEKDLESLSKDGRLALSDVDLRRRRLAELLSPSEQRVLEKAYGVKWWKRLPEPKEKSAPGEKKRDGVQPLIVHTANEYPNGYVKSVLDLAGCRGADGANAMTATFLPGGRPQSISIAGRDRDPACERASRALLLSILKPDQHRRRTILLPVTAAFLSCVASASRTFAVQDVPRQAASQNTKIEPPKKIVNRSPRYPTDARARRAQGVVLLEAIISPSGCVEFVRLLYSPDPALSLESIAAVAEWAYTPVLLNGEAVPVIMTVTTNFRLDLRVPAKDSNSAEFRTPPR